MRARISLIAVFLVLALAFLASPYMALWRMEAALDRGDVRALEGKVDWNALRAGLKQDIADGIIGPVQTQLAANTLPPFGASFVGGIADTAVDRDVTAQNVVATMRQMRADDSQPDCIAGLAWAFFRSPTSFDVVIRTTDDDAHLRLRLVLRAGGWVLVRAWVPQDLIDRASHRT